MDKEHQALIEELSKTIEDKKVLEALIDTPRHEFIPDFQKANAYQNQALPIGHEQTISQPFIVGYMTEHLQPDPSHKVLEIGTGSGYQAAVLSHLVKEIYTIEIVEPLAKIAHQTFDHLGYKNIHTRIGDGHKGWPEEAPFDRIIVTCAPENIPPELCVQLREGGRMIIPIGPEGKVQKMTVLEKQGGKIEEQETISVYFVPMTGGERVTETTK